MTTSKRSKPAATADPGVVIELAPKSYKRRDGNLTILAQQIVDLSSDQIETFLDQLKEQLNSRNDVYSPAQTIIDVLTTPELERETRGEEKNAPKKNPQTGQFIAKAFDIKTQRMINRILNEIEPKLEKLGSDPTKHKAITITLKPADAKYMAERMMLHFNEFASVQPYIPDAYDQFADIKAEAVKAVDKSD